MLLMSFASPFWLLAVLPWAGFAIWLLWGRRRRVDVPFIELWKGSVTAKRGRRALELPPLALAAALIALLLAVVGAARPVARIGPFLSTLPITIILDHGLTMSAPAQSPRYRQLVDSA